MITPSPAGRETKHSPRLFLRRSTPLGRRSLAPESQPRTPATTAAAAATRLALALRLLQCKARQPRRGTGAAAITAPGCSEAHCSHARRRCSCGRLARRAALKDGRARRTTCGRASRSRRLVSARPRSATDVSQGASCTPARTYLCRRLGARAAFDGAARLGSQRDAASEEPSHLRGGRPWLVLSATRAGAHGRARCARKRAQRSAAHGTTQRFHTHTDAPTSRSRTWAEPRRQARQSSGAIGRVSGRYQPLRPRAPARPLVPSLAASSRTRAHLSAPPTTSPRRPRGLTRVTRPDRSAELQASTRARPPPLRRAQTGRRQRCARLQKT